jgi:hypothetical protein
MSDELLDEVRARRSRAKATQPRARGTRAGARGSSASRSCSASRKSIWRRSALTGSSSGRRCGSPTPAAVAREDVLGEQAGAGSHDLVRNPERQRAEHVDRRAEPHEARDALVAPVGDGLVAEHPALGVADEVHLADQ